MSLEVFRSAAWRRKILILMGLVWCAAGPGRTLGQALNLTQQLRGLVYSPNLESHLTGYWPVVCTFENQAGTAQEVEVRCPANNAARDIVNWQVSRRVRVEGGSTARITLWLPAPTSPQLLVEFLVNGRPVSSWTPNRALYGRYGSESADLPLILASSEAARIARQLRFERYYLTEQPAGHHGSGYPGALVPPPWGATLPTTLPPPGSSGPSGPVQAELLLGHLRELQLTVWEAPLAVWDNNWIGYTPFQGIVVTPKDWEAAPAEVKEALLRWVECGGQLLILDLSLHIPYLGRKVPEKPSPGSDGLSKTNPGIVPPPFENAGTGTGAESAQARDEPADGDAAERRRRILTSLPHSDPFSAIWANSPDQLKRLEPRPLPCGFGNVFYVVGHYLEQPPSGGQKSVVGPAESQLAWWAESVGTYYRRLLENLHNAESLLESELRVARSTGVPVLGFFLLLVVFSVLIGPVAILILNRYQKLIHLIWAIPVVAFTTCLVIFIYGFLGEGVSARVAIRSLTLLDERHHRATTLAVMGIYSPITPPGGVQWEYDLEPTFLSQYRETHGYYRGPRGPYSESTKRQLTIDWTQRQHLTSGWVLPRVREFVVVRRSETRRERLTLHRRENRLLAANNLGVDLRNLLVCDPQGKWWRADRLAAGAEVELQPCAPPEDYAEKLAELERSEDSPKPMTPRRMYCPGLLSAWLVGADRAVSGSWWLSSLCSAAGPSPAALLCPGRYFAELEGCPFVDSGLRWVGVREERCWIVGILETSPR